MLWRWGHGLCAVKPGGEDTAFVLSNLAVRTRPLCCQTWRWGHGLCAVKPGGEDTAFVLSNLAVRTQPLCCQTWRWGHGLCAVKLGGEDVAFVLSNLAVRTWPLCCQTWQWGCGLCAVNAFFITLKYNAPSLITRPTSSQKNPMPPAVSLLLWKHTAARRLLAFFKEYRGFSCSLTWPEGVMVGL